MSQLRKILGTSLMSLFLVIWGLFMVCSGRVPGVNIDDDFSAIEGDYDEQDKADLVSQLAMLDEGTANLEDSQKAEILAALGIDPTGSDVSLREEEDFLTEELFLDLEVEIAELEKLSRNKSAMIDSLNAELLEADYQFAALSNVVTEPEPETRMVSTVSLPPRLKVANGASADYELFYQEALDEVYSHNYRQAIAKFQDLLRQNSKEQLADNCQYWIGECRFALRDYEIAIAEFEKVFAFDDNNKADDAQFMIGMSYLKIGDPNLAQLELSNLLIFYDKSEYASKAQQQLQDLNI